MPNPSAQLLVCSLLSCPASCNSLLPWCAAGTLRSPGLQVDKTAFDPMPSPVKRVFYLSADKGQLQHEVWPEVNKGVLDNIASADAIVYGIGSLYTSICPSLVLQVEAQAWHRPYSFPVYGLPEGRSCCRTLCLDSIQLACKQWCAET